MGNDVNVYENVASTLQMQLEELIDDYEDNLARKMESEVSGYSADYCAEEAYGPHMIEYGKRRESGISDLVEAMLAVLFANG